MTNQEITIDATDKTLGRLASEIAIKLRGKDQVDFTYHENKGPRITVENVQTLKLTGKKGEFKKYITHSGHPGGLKTTLAKNMTPSKMLWRAVHRMLPKNRLRAQIIKRLVIK